MSHHPFAPSASGLAMGVVAGTAGGTPTKCSGKINLVKDDQTTTNHKGPAFDANNVVPAVDNVRATGRA